MRALLLMLALSVAVGAPTARAAIRVPEEYDTLQGAIDAASPGDTVLVGPGTHSGDGNVNLSFGGKDIVLLAPAGPESTIIDCESMYRGLTFESGESPAAVVDGLTIANGRGTKGAGIRCWYASPTIRNVVLRDNRTGTWVDCRGGAVDCQFGSPTFENVTFLRNESGVGGGIACSQSTLSLVDVSFLDNWSYNAGGGIYCYSSSVTLDGAIFEGNESDYYGACVYLFRADLDVVDSRFEGNLSGASGAGLYCRDCAPISLTDVEFLRNSAAREGGGLFFDGCSAMLARVTFARNTAGTYGGAVSLSGGTTGEFINVTVVANSAPSRGGGICCRASHPSITLSILCFNAGRDAILCVAGADPTVTRCVVYGNEMGDALCGTCSEILSVDPLLCDMYTDDLRLCGNSPCLPGQPGNPWGEPVGAHGQGCGACDSPVEGLSWGTIKAMFKKPVGRSGD